ncbi:MAG: heat-inducible transcription repressor HrcA [Anaerolineae bacterium]|nr:heat-inducible transcription repressor HrcA [Anaerolineae bacterium]
MSEVIELTPRQQTVLGLTVREYVKSASPVSSRALVEHYGLPVSSATVRNELAYLEDTGLLTHPHTSAGRVPTHEGYRYFVERLLGEVELPLRERLTIVHQFHQARDNLEQWMPLAASTLARTARGAAVVTAPQSDRARYKHLQLISTRGLTVLLVLVLRSGLVRQRMLTLAEPLAQRELAEASDRLNQLFAGLTAEDIGEALGDEGSALSAFEDDVGRLVEEILHRVDAPSAGPIYSDGLSEVLQQPEFSEGEKAQQIVQVMEERSLLRTVIYEALSPDIGNVRVLVGGEGQWDQLHACSLVLARYGVSDLSTGALGVVGPTRMLYGRAISAVRFVAELLSELVHETYAAEIAGDRESGAFVAEEQGDQDGGQGS